MIAFVLALVGAWVVFAVLRHACSPRQTYTGRHHVTGVTHL